MPNAVQRRDAARAGPGRGVIVCGDARGGTSWACRNDSNRDACLLDHNAYRGRRRRNWCDRCWRCGWAHLDRCSHLNMWPTCSEMEFNGSGTSRCVAYGSTCGDFVAALLFNVAWAPIFAVILGTIPGIVALTLTPAKEISVASAPSAHSRNSGWFYDFPISRPAFYRLIPWLAYRAVFDPHGYGPNYGVEHRPSAPTFSFVRKRFAAALGSVTTAAKTRHLLGLVSLRAALQQRQLSPLCCYAIGAAIPRSHNARKAQSPQRSNAVQRRDAEWVAGRQRVGAGRCRRHGPPQGVQHLPTSRSLTSS
jgi:hypothetical protein